MPSLYIDRRGLDLRYEHGTLVIFQNHTRLRALPLLLFDRLVITAPVSLSSTLLEHLALRGISVLVLPLRSAVACHLLGFPSPDAARRLAQSRAAFDPHFPLLLARRLLRLKLNAHLRLLRRLAAPRPDLRKPVFDAAASISSILPQLPTAPSLSSLLGFEGAAAAAYFQAFSASFPPALQFHSRNRRPPRDPVNAALSLAYTLLHAAAAHTLSAAGLDPAIGFFHQPKHSRLSLASDLLEPLRAAADSWVHSLFARRLLRLDHFSTHQGASLLSKTGRQHFYREFEAFLPLPQRRFRRLTRLLLRALRAWTPEPSLWTDETSLLDPLSAHPDLP